MGVVNMKSGLFRRLFRSGALAPAGRLAEKALPWKKQIPGQLALRLEFNRKILYEISGVPSTTTITIGRSSDCTWVIPGEDSVASGHHAVILMRKGRCCLRDTGSRNGIFYRSRRIQEKNLAPGDQFVIGSCTLIVEKVRAFTALPHTLVYLNTDKKGEEIKLDRARIAAGAAPGCDIFINEQLVSQHHAEFCSKADGCWLKDLGSKNGTFVNGTKLSPNTERLLVDDDVVSISFVDLKFVDGRVEHSKIRIWYSLGVVAATVFAVLMLNWLWMGMKGSSDACLELARREAAAARFDRAGELLRESRTRRGAENNEIARNELDRSIAVWEKVAANWGKARSTLKTGDWIGASRILGAITEADPNLWGWNDTSAPEMRKEAFAVKKLLDAFLLAESAMRDDRNRENSADLKRALRDMSETERLFAAKVPEYLKKLLADSASMRSQISRNLRYLEELKSILARIETEAENLAAVLADLENLKESAEPNIRLRIESSMVPLTMLQRSGKEVRRAMMTVRQLEFAELDKIRLELPSLEQCAVNAGIATLRKKQERQFDAILAAAANLRPLVRRLEELGMNENAGMPEYVLVFRDKALMEQVFACDVLTRKMPPRLRRSPAGAYDRVLGIEGFFEFIYALPAPYDQSIYAEFKFRPEIVKFRDLLAAVGTFRAFADRRENDWLLAGKFQELCDRTDAVRKFRDRLVADMRAARYTSPRASILGRAMAFFLAEGQVGERELDKFSKDLKQLRLPLIRSGREYNSAPAEQKIRIRDEILRQGIPGDPVVRRMWGFKTFPR